MNDSHSKGTIDAETVVAIHNRYAQYCWAADSRDKALYADNYTEDAVLMNGEYKLVGREAVASTMDFALTNRHLITTLSIDEFGDGTARVHAYILVLDEGGNIAGIAEGRDTLVREEDGAWRWSFRDVLFPYMSDAYKANVEAAYWGPVRERASELSP